MDTHKRHPTLWWLRDQLCECSHDGDEHSRQHPHRCTGLDSYGFTCECPSFVLWPDEFDDPDSDADE